MIEIMYIHYAKFVVTILLCIIYLPFSITDLYLSMYMNNICTQNTYELALKEYLMLISYAETTLLFISIFILLSPLNWIHHRIVLLYTLIYGGIFTIYIGMILIGMYMYMQFINNYCNGLSEYICVSLFFKSVVSVMMMYVLCNQ